MDRWCLDEIVIVMGRRRFYLWRAVDSEGEVLDFLVQRRLRGQAFRQWKELAAAA